jgi:hypothetical protein
MHIGVANVELLNTLIYKKFVKKSHKLQSKYVRFNPHPRSLDGIVAPSEEALQEWGFKDLNTALASTVEAFGKYKSCYKTETSSQGRNLYASETSHCGRHTNSQAGAQSRYADLT